MTRPPDGASPPRAEEGKHAGGARPPSPGCQRRHLTFIAVRHLRARTTLTFRPDDEAARRGIASPRRGGKAHRGARPPPSGWRLSRLAGSGLLGSVSASRRCSGPSARRDGRGAETIHAGAPSSAHTVL